MAFSEATSGSPQAVHPPTRASQLHTLLRLDVNDARLRFSTAVPRLGDLRAVELRLLSRPREAAALLPLAPAGQATEPALGSKPTHQSRQGSCRYCRTRSRLAAYCQLHTS